MMLQGTPLHLAAEMGHLPVVQYLCEQGANKEAENDLGRTPLLCAVQYGKKGLLPVVQCLCEQGANEDARDRAGLTPLKLATIHQAEAEGTREIMIYLAERLPGRLEKAQKQTEAAKERSAAEAQVRKDYFEYEKKTLEHKRELERLKAEEANISAEAERSKMAQQFFPNRVNPLLGAQEEEVFYPQIGRVKVDIDL
jgi:hypothetical protein